MKTNQWRFERKFFIKNYSQTEILNKIKQHPAIFKDIYHSRQVNNVYFDSLGFKNYIANVEGVAEREKVRVRWYGEKFGNIENPILEFKIKRGYLGFKKYYPLKTFTMSEQTGTSDLLKMMGEATLSPQTRHTIRSLQPRLANSYTRKYYLSSDKKFRLTVDTNIRFFQLSLFHPAFREQYFEDQGIVMELKYSSSDKNDTDAREITNNFPFRMTKNSKYVIGVEVVYF